MGVNLCCPVAYSEDGGICFPVCSTVKLALHSQDVPVFIFLLKWQAFNLGPGWLLKRELLAEKRRTTVALQVRLSHPIPAQYSAKQGQCKNVFAGVSTRPKWTSQR